MSRQRGSRPRPAPEQRRYHEQFVDKRGRAPRVSAELSPPTRRRRWAAVLFATLVLVFAFTGIVTAIVEQDEGDSDAARLAVTIAVLLVPIAFTILARVSRATHPFRRVLIASPLAMAGYVGAGALMRDPTSSLVLAFGVAGAFVLRTDPPHRVSQRVTVVAVAAIVTLLLYAVASAAAVVAAPFLPFAASMVADRIAEARGGAGGGFPTSG